MFFTDAQKTLIRWIASGEVTDVVSFAKKTSAFKEMPTPPLEFSNHSSFKSDCSENGPGLWVIDSHEAQADLEMYGKLIEKLSYLELISVRPWVKEKPFPCIFSREGDIYQFCPYVGADLWKKKHILKVEDELQQFIDRGFKTEIEFELDEERRFRKNAQWISIIVGGLGLVFAAGSLVTAVYVTMTNSTQRDVTLRNLNDPTHPLYVKIVPSVPQNTPGAQ